MLPRHWAMKFWAIQCLPPTAKGSRGNGVTLNHRRSCWVTASLLPRFSTREGQGGGIKNLFCSSAQYHSLALHNPFNPPRLRDNANRGRTSGSENTASRIQAQNKERVGAWKGQGNTLRKIFFTIFRRVKKKCISLQFSRLIHFVFFQEDHEGILLPSSSSKFWCIYFAFVVRGLMLWFSRAPDSRQPHRNPGLQHQLFSFCFLPAPAHLYFCFINFASIFFAWFVFDLQSSALMAD